MKNEFVELGRMIKHVRMDAHLSQKQMANKIGLSASSLNNFEKGLRRISLVQAFKIQYELGMKDSPLSDYIIAGDFAAATESETSGKTFRTTGGGIKPGAAANENRSQLDTNSDRVITVPVKLPSDIYLKLEFK